MGARKSVPMISCSGTFEENFCFEESSDSLKKSTTFHLNTNKCLTKASIQRRLLTATEKSYGSLSSKGMVYNGQQKKVQLVLQHCCKTSWIAMLRVYLRKILLQPYLCQERFERGWQTRNIALQPCCKTSCTFSVARFTVELGPGSFSSSFVFRWTTWRCSMSNICLWCEVLDKNVWPR